MTFFYHEVRRTSARLVLHCVGLEGVCGMRINIVGGFD